MDKIKALVRFGIAMTLSLGALSILGCPKSQISPAPERLRPLDLWSYDIIAPLEIVDTSALGWGFDRSAQIREERFGRANVFTSVKIKTQSKVSQFRDKFDYDALTKFGLASVVDLSKRNARYFTVDFTSQIVYEIVDHGQVNWSALSQDFDSFYISRVYVGDIVIYDSASIGDTIGVVGKSFRADHDKSTIGATENSTTGSYCLLRYSNLRKEIVADNQFEHDLKMIRSHMAADEWGRALSRLNSLIASGSQDPRLHFNLACVMAESSKVINTTDTTARVSLINQSAEHFEKALDAGIDNYIRISGQSTIPYWRILRDPNLSVLFEARPTLVKRLDYLRLVAGEPTFEELDSIARATEKARLGVGGGCLAQGTLVTMASGQVRLIEEIKIGDSLLSYNLMSNQLETSLVTNVKSHTADTLFIINGSIQATGIHPFYVQGDWVIARELKLGQLFLRSDLSICAIESIASLHSDALVYDLEVKSNSNYFAGGVLVHNKMIE